MIELPEAVVLAHQLEQEFQGKKITGAEAMQSPHKFAFFNGDPAAYNALLTGRMVQAVEQHGGHVEFVMDGGLRLDFNDGTNFSYIAPGGKCPPKHQLLLEFEDDSALAVKVQMYGALMAFREGEYDNPYYLVGYQKPDALGDEFSQAYFKKLLAESDLKKLSAKAFLATEQRIPGVGNGVTQDILWRAKLNPRTKMATLDARQEAALYRALRETLAQMAAQGGRDMEKNIYGNAGGYKTVMSKNNAELVCPACGGGVKKEAYLGGSVYYCPSCQPQAVR